MRGFQNRYFDTFAKDAEPGDKPASVKFFKLHQNMLEPRSSTVGMTLAKLQSNALHLAHVATNAIMQHNFHKPTRNCTMRHFDS
jgi:hypothetical protein